MQRELVTYDGPPLPSGYEPPSFLRCWNGKSSLRPDCGHYGSQNLPPAAWAKQGQWKRFLDLANIWQAEGVFGREIGSDSTFYHLAILDYMDRARVKVGRAAGGDQILRAMRAALAWDILTAVAQGVGEEEAIDVEGRQILSPTKKNGAGLGVMVAVSGMRHSTEEHGDLDSLSSDGSHSRALAKALDLRSQWLTPEEVRIARDTIFMEDAEAARRVASWMWGTIDLPALGGVPEVAWGFRLRRTTEGTESINFGSREPVDGAEASLGSGAWVNPHKPARAACQALNDGTLRTLRATPREVKLRFLGGKFEAGDYRVTVEDGIIRAHSFYGDTEMPELGGSVLWQVDVRGSKIYWTTPD